jgi:hypothetical protein
MHLQALPAALKYSGSHYPHQVAICAHRQLNYIKTPRFPPPPICPLRPISSSFPALTPMPRHLMSQTSAH